MSETKIEQCSFCGNHKDIVRKLIVSESVAICSDCVTLCVDLIADDSKPELSADRKALYDAALIAEYLDLHVIGQEKAKMILSIAIANHYKRITYPPKDIEINKGNILLVGPTGSGKTLLAKTVAKFLDVPFVVADATSLTEAGYVGDDVESMIAMLLNAANGDKELAERGIIFIDEVDKIARKSESSSITRDVSGEGVQQALLKLVEGTRCRVPAAGGRKHPSGEMIEVDTKNILFIAGGAFTGLKEIIQRRIRGASIGFTSEAKYMNDDEWIPVTPDDLIKYGMIPEFVGRFTTTVALTNLNETQLLRVLTEIKNNYVDQYKYLFSLDGIDLTFDAKALKQIVKNCITLHTGARGLHTEFERVLMLHMFNIKEYQRKNISKINISQEMVINPKKIT